MIDMIHRRHNIWLYLATINTTNELNEVLNVMRNTSRDGQIKQSKMVLLNKHIIMSTLPYERLFIF